MRNGVPPGPPAEGTFDAPEAPVLRCPSCGANVPEADRACAHCGSLLSTRRCPACFALSPREAERCVRCGALLPAEALKPAEGTCPDCRQPLVAREAGVVGFAECARCGGLFLTRVAFDAIAKDANARARVRAAEPETASREASLAAKFHYRKCPVCRALMGRTNYAGGSGIIVDVCRTHGVWFDRGELTAIVDFLEAGGAERLRKREQQRIEEEVSALEGRKRAAQGLPPATPDSGGSLASVIGFLGNIFR